MAKNGYVEENTEGFFRVRDRDEKDGSPTIVWGSHLTHAEAHQLKERVCGAEKSTTARIESMDVPLVASAVNPQGQPLRNEPPPGLPSPRGLVSQSVGTRPSSVVTPSSGLHPNPAVAEAQRKAMAAARAPAQQAQQRSDNLIALPQHLPQGAAIDVADLDPSQELAQSDLQVPDPDALEGELDDLLDGPSSDPATI